MDDFIEKYCNCSTENKSAHILEDHINDILSKQLRPVFKQQTSMHKSLTKRPEPKYASAADQDLFENQLWKSENHVELLIWIIKEIPPKKLEENLHLLIPPVLIVLDDYDLLYKEQGVIMVHEMVKKLDVKSVSRLGLDDLFIESLFKCLTYLSQDRDVDLLKVAYPCILDLIATKRNEQVRSNLYERVLKDGIINGFIYAGEKIRFLPILFEPISVLYNELGVIGVQYIKAIIPVLCSSLTMKNSNYKNIHTLALESLTIIIKKCWPRIPSYKGIIMQALAKSWAFYFEKKDEAMCKLIKETYQVFEAACDGEEKADKEALLSFNSEIFNGLFL